MARAVIAGVIIFLILFPLLSSAQKPSLNFEHFGTREGLSQINVNSIIQDSQWLYVGSVLATGLKQV